MAHRRAIEVIGQNITNANTEGYTRRLINLQPAGTASGAALFARPTNYGSGVDVASVTHVRDEFLDVRQRREAADSSGTSTTANALAAIESLMPEPSNNGISHQLSKFWGAFDDAAANPSNIPLSATFCSSRRRRSPPPSGRSRDPSRTVAQPRQRGRQHRRRHQR